TREEEEESFDPIPRTPEDSEDDGNGKEDQGLRASEEQRLIEEEEADELYRDIDINQGLGLQVSQDIEDSHVTLTLVKPDGQQESSSVSSFVTSMLNSISDAGVESIFTTASSPVAPLPTPTPTMTPSTITTITTATQAPIPPTPIPSEILQNLPTFDLVFRFNERLKSLEASFSYYRQTNLFAEAVSNIPENDELRKTIDDNMKRIIKEQVKSQVKDQVSRILPRIEQSVNAQLESKVLTRNLYKALVDAYEADKTIIDSYGETAILKRRREDDDDQEGPSARSDRGSKRRREGGESESARAPLEPATTSAGSAQTWISELAKQADSRSSFNELLDTSIDFSNFIMNRLGVDTLTPELLAGPTYELMRGSCNSLTELEYHLEEVYKATTDQLDWIYKFKEGDFKRLRLQDIEDMLLLLVQGKLSNLTVEERFAFNISLRMFTRSIVIQWRVEDLQLGVKSYQKRLNLTKPDTYRSDLKRREAYTAYSNPRGFIYQNKDKKNRLIRIDELHKFSDGTLNDVRNALDDRLKGIRMQYLPQTIWRKGEKDRAAAMIQAIDKILKTRRIMRSLERFVGGRLMFTRSIVIQRRVEDLQLGVKSYRKRLNLTKPDTYRSDLKRREAYTAYSNLRGFIYQNRDKKNKLMRINELYKFSDGTLNDVRNALDDRLKGIRMQYLPTTIWRKGDQDKAAAMIQAIDKMLKTRRIMRSLESELLMKRLAKSIEFVDVVAKIIDHEFFERARHSFDAALRSALECIVTASGPKCGDWYLRLSTLPFAFTGLVLELMLLKRPKENTKCVSAAGEKLTAAKHRLELKLFRDAAAHMK
nr:hypothetical protein [Tanacetum cinerariifolium]